MHATAHRHATSAEPNPFLRFLGDVLTGFSLLFGFSPATPGRAVAPLPAVTPAATPAQPAARIEPVAPVEFASEPKAEVITVRTAPTALGSRVVEALAGREPLRKIQIAALVGIGRGSANRIVDRLVVGGWLIEDGEGTYALA